MSETLFVERSGAVATIIMNRPKALNALNREMSRELKTVTAQLAEDDSVRCVVISGAGEHFMAGGDIFAFHEGVDRPKDDFRDLIEVMIGDIHEAIVTLRSMPKPVIASARGAVAGFGISLLSACDLAVVSENAMFTLAYCHIGATPDGGSTFFLPRMVGLKRATELVLLGERFDANEAHRIGLINRVVVDDNLNNETTALAERLAGGPTGVYANAKQLLLKSFETDLKGQLQAEMASFTDCALSDDFKEGVSAFVEKRPARFTGK